jgi:hypothetical protein
VEEVGVQGSVNVTRQENFGAKGTAAPECNQRLEAGEHLDGLVREHQAFGLQERACDSQPR